MAPSESYGVPSWARPCFSCSLACCWPHLPCLDLNFCVVGCPMISFHLPQGHAQNTLQGLSSGPPSLPPRAAPTVHSRQCPQPHPSSLRPCPSRWTCSPLSLPPKSPLLPVLPLLLCPRPGFLHSGHSGSETPTGVCAYCTAHSCLCRHHLRSHLYRKCSQNLQGHHGPGSHLPGRRQRSGELNACPLRQGVPEHLQPLEAGGHPHGSQGWPGPPGAMEMPTVRPPSLLSVPS